MAIVFSFFSRDLYKKLQDTLWPISHFKAVLYITVNIINIINITVFRKISHFQKILGLISDANIDDFVKFRESSMPRS